MLQLVCAQCGQLLTAPLQPSERSAQERPGQPLIPAGGYKPSWNGGYILNRDDIHDAEPHPDPQRRTGCCGPTGAEGPNLVCAHCGTELATEEADCWKPHFVVTIPGALTPITETPTDRTS